MKKRTFFWGFVLVLMAVCLIAGQYDAFGEIGMWKIILSVVGGALVLDGLVQIGVESIVVGAVLLCFLWREQLGLGSLNIGTVAVAAILLIVGLNILLHPFQQKINAWKMRREMRKYDRQIHSANANGNGNAGPNGNANAGFSTSAGYTQNQNVNQTPYVKLKRSFGGATEQIVSGNFQKADIELNFAGMKVVLERAQIQGNEAEIHVDVNFSGLSLLVPCEWIVEDRVQCFAGGNNVQQREQNIAPTKVLRLTGNVAFGGVTVHYV